MKTSHKAAGALAIAVTIVGAFEGYRTTAYRDPIGVLTVCAGETKGVRPGDHYSMAECRDMLASRLAEFNAKIDTCIKVPMPDPRRAALISFSYNIGTGAFCRSTLVKRLNAGDTRGACNELLKWDKAGGRVLPGLTIRRQKERALCLVGL